jgi:hypothetical protein
VKMYIWKKSYEKCNRKFRVWSRVFHFLQNQACLIVEGANFQRLLIHAVDCEYTVKPIITTLINVTRYL